MAGRRCAICREYTDYKDLDADGICKKPGCREAMREITKWAKDTAKYVLDGYPILKKPKGYHV